MSTLSARSHQLNNDETVVVRPTKAEDAPGVTQLFQSHLNWINVNHPPEAVFHRMIPSADIVESLAEYPGAVVETPDRIIGFGMTHPRAPYLTLLRNLYVDDVYRNRGLGSSLLSIIEEQCWEVGIRTIIATASVAWYPGKLLPTRLFRRHRYEVIDLDDGLELYINRREGRPPLDPKRTDTGLPEIQRFKFHTDPI